MTPEPVLHRPYAALSYAAFRWFTASLLTMTVSAQVQAVVIGWLVYQITRDPRACGLLRLAHVVPYVAVALLAVYLVDRSGRRRVSVIALSILVVAAGGVWAFSALAPELAIVWPFYVAIAVCGIARSFLQI